MDTKEQRRKKNTTHNRLTIEMLRMMNETRYITFCSVDLNARIRNKYRPFFASINFFSTAIVSLSFVFVSICYKKNNNHHRPLNSLCAIEPIILGCFFVIYFFFRRYRSITQSLCQWNQLHASIYGHF